MADISTEKVKDKAAFKEKRRHRFLEIEDLNSQIKRGKALKKEEYADRPAKSREHLSKGDNPSK